MPLTKDEISQIADAVAESVRQGHTCRFTTDEADVVHGFGRAIKAHGAGEKELFVVIQIGKNVVDFVERAGKAILWAIIISAATFLLSGVIPIQWRFWK